VDQRLGGLGVTTRPVKANGPGRMADYNECVFAMEQWVLVEAPMAHGPVGPG
jgi:hypothetical protein